MKIRVYELAKELNMTNKALLDKIKKMGDISVRSHMSSLDARTIETIKTRLLGKPEKSQEKRVKPTVIRRRRKNSEPENQAAEDDDILDQEEEKPQPEEIQDDIAEAEIPAIEEPKVEPVDETPSKEEAVNPPEKSVFEKEDDKIEKKLNSEKEVPEQVMKQESAPQEKKELQPKKEKPKKKKNKGGAKIIFRPEPQPKMEPKAEKNEIKEKPIRQEKKQTVQPDRTNENNSKPAVLSGKETINKKRTPKKKEGLFVEIETQKVDLQKLAKKDDFSERSDKLNKGRNSSEEAKKPKKKKKKARKKEVVEGEELYDNNSHKKGKKGKNMNIV